MTTRIGGGQVVTIASVFEAIVEKSFEAKNIFAVRNQKVRIGG